MTQNAEQKAKSVLAKLTQHTSPETYAKDLGISVGSIRTTVRRAATHLGVEVPKLPWSPFASPRSTAAVQDGVSEDTFKRFATAMVTQIKDLKSQVESLRAEVDTLKANPDHQDPAATAPVSDPVLKKFGLTAAGFKPATSYAHPDAEVDPDDEDGEYLPLDGERLTDEQLAEQMLQDLLK